MLRTTRVQLDSQALLRNLETLQKCNGSTAFFCPMVKANAYGHGDIQVARTIEHFQKVSAVGVALVEEGLRLREAGLRLPILVFAPFDRAAASAMLTHQLTPVVGRTEDLNSLLAVSGKSPVGIHLKFNTGMNRLGFDEKEIDPLKQTLQRNPQLAVEGVCTHLTHGDEAHEPEGPTSRQLNRLKSMSKGFPGKRHGHKSSSLAVLAEHDLTKDPEMGARVGISLYGLPYEGERVAPGLTAVLRWSTTLTHIHMVEAGAAVSYGARWVAARRSCIGVLPVGYGDGYIRALSNCGEVLFRGKRVPVVGSVCMDYTLIDLTNAIGEGHPQAGEEVVLLGRQGQEEITAGFLAKRAGTIAYEIVTSIRRRVAHEAQ